MKKKKIQNQKVHTDRYLITYADLLTLLLGLFAILFATSQVDLAKYREVAAAMSNVFNPIESNEKKADKMAVPNTNSLALPPPPILMTNKNNKSIELIRNETQSALKNLITDKKINFDVTNKGFKITLNESLLFLSGRSELQAEAVTVLDSIANSLKLINKQINIDGHTDATPLRSMRYESNWHLSMARALAVAYQLMRNGVPEHDIAIRSFGAQRPVADNATEAGKEKNRRVEIVITDKDDNAAAILNKNPSDSLPQ